jgi:hypothetical protein
MFQQHPSEHVHLGALLPRTLSSRFVSQFVLDAGYSSVLFFYARIYLQERTLAHPYPRWEEERSSELSYTVRRSLLFCANGL